MCRVREKKKRKKGKEKKGKSGWRRRRNINGKKKVFGLSIFLIFFFFFKHACGYSYLVWNGIGDGPMVKRSPRGSDSGHGEVGDWFEAMETVEFRSLFSLLSFFFSNYFV